MTSTAAIDPVVRSAYKDLLKHNRFTISNAYTAVQSVVCIGAFAVLAWVGLRLDHVTVWLITWPLQSFLLAGFFGASHDCLHCVHYTHPLANRAAGMFWATITSINFTLYKHFHLDHHQFVGTNDDTEPAGEFDSLRSYLSSLPTIQFFYTFWRMSAGAVRGRFPHFIRNADQRRNVLLDDVALLAWFVAVIVSTVLWPRQMLVAYLVPLALFFPMVFIFSLPEHYGCDYSTDWRRNTRTITSNSVTSYLYWNGNYHADHHVFPRLPSRYLPDAHCLLDGVFAFSGRSYAVFHVRLIRQLLSASAKAPLETGVQKVLSPSERVHFKGLLTNYGYVKDVSE